MPGTGTGLIEAPTQVGDYQGFRLIDQLDTVEGGDRLDTNDIMAFERSIQEELLGTNGLYAELLAEWQNQGFGFSSIEEVYRRGTCKIVTERLFERLASRYPGTRIMKYQGPYRHLFHYHLQVPFHGRNVRIDPTWQQVAPEFDGSLPPVVLWWEEGMNRGKEPAFWQHVGPYSFDIWKGAKPL